METVKAILAVLGGAGAVVAAVCAAFAIMFRDTLTAWLTKRVAKGLERDAERYKHELSRDMENYKDELNRAQSVERLRAEMRKTVAEKIFALRLDAYHELYKALTQTPALIMSYSLLPAGSRSTLDETVAQISGFNTALETHQLYVDKDFRNTYRTIATRLLGLFESGEWETAEPLKNESEKIRTLSRLVGTLLEEIERMHTRLPDDLADGVANSVAHREGTQP
ncbi:hypothetical protein [Paraburkholderia strydomiana]|uniref:hypothetical protein n=1 Tax=Paraburkholderia strydomiana TaxID=1245417 RepID=UPI001BE4F366|nr:hypothetical protein [Paraburkholderia strydomiana]MBT2789158.1 hypothetical protein [Paraburkholderia strydomiana]